MKSDTEVVPLREAWGWQLKPPLEEQRAEVSGPWEDTHMWSYSGAVLPTSSQESDSGGGFPEQGLRAVLSPDIGI